ncbi:hypothetical protein [Streptomyces sp. NRRL S-495]|uniref:hypothetical protein n=1 Tax=Streptomyces sp. NRRL S-495 TaxID=1609133 RepID=UPI0005F8E25D|nr:hypothetical protein [Streptomyces sp. NRRL S-495]KJY30265.1 hypothetical protein VR45_28015 [Streptomyces sp. NRRL S-495]
MDRRTPITSGRRYTWLPALALVAVAVAGCSSSGGGSTAASAPPSTAGTATAPGTGTGTGTASSPTSTAPTPAAPPSATSTPTTAPTTATTPAGTGKRPADACTLLTSPQVIAAVGTAGPFNGTHFDPVDGKPVWGCTWGSRQSYADIRETSPSNLAALKTNPEFTVTPLPGVGQEAYLVQRKDGFRPEVYFVAADGRAYSVEVVKDRGPNDDANAPAEAAAASGLALALSKLV